MIVDRSERKRLLSEGRQFLRFLRERRSSRRRMGTATPAPSGSGAERVAAHGDVGHARRASAREETTRMALVVGRDRPVPRRGGALRVPDSPDRHGTDRGGPGGLGLSLPLIIGIEAFAVLANTLSWRCTIAPERRGDVPFRRLMAARIVGDAVNYVIPAGAGEIPKIRLLSQYIPMELAVASVALAKLTEGIALGLFGHPRSRRGLAHPDGQCRERRDDRGCGARRASGSWSGVWSRCAWGSRPPWSASSVASW